VQVEAVEEILQVAHLLAAQAVAVTVALEKAVQANQVQLIQVAVLAVELMLITALLMVVLELLY
jgi:hypothetical protein